MPGVVFGVALKLALGTAGCCHPGPRLPISSVGWWRRDRLGRRRIGLTVIRRVDEYSIEVMIALALAKRPCSLTDAPGVSGPLSWPG